MWRGTCCNHQLNSPAHVEVASPISFASEVPAGGDIVVGPSAIHDNRRSGVSDVSMITAEQSTMLVAEMCLFFPETNPKPAKKDFSRRT